MEKITKLLCVGVVVGFLFGCFSVIAAPPRVTNLKDAVTHTLQTNPDVLIKVKGWLAAKQGIKKAQGGYFPSLDFGDN